MPRWFPLLISVALGIALGLVYGWVLDPVEFTDTTPDTLRADYRADYVLMIAEAFQVEQDPDQAARRLALLGSQPPGDIAGDAVDQARLLGFDAADLAVMQELTTAMQAWQPVSNGGAP